MVVRAFNSKLWEAEARRPQAEAGSGQFKNNDNKKGSSQGRLLGEDGENGIW